MEEVLESSRKLQGLGAGARERAFTNADVYDRVKAHLERLDWHVIGTAERDEDRLRALRAIKVAEGRQAGEKPAWAEGIQIRPNQRGLTVIPSPRGPLSDERRELLYGRDLSVRLDEAALAGKLSKDEYDEIRDWL